MGIFPKKGVISLKPPASFFPFFNISNTHWILKEILKKIISKHLWGAIPKATIPKHQEKSIQNFVEEKSQGQPPGMYKTL